jgi:hypothetical protein
VTYAYVQHPADCPGCGTYSGTDEDLCPIGPPARDVWAERLTANGYTNEEIAELWRDPA